MKPSVVLAFKSKVGASLYGHLKVPILNAFPSFLASCVARLLNMTTSGPEMTVVKWTVRS